MESNRRTIKLTEEQWRNLEAIAGQVGARATRGPQPQKISWRALVRQIATGEVLVRPKRRRRKEPHADPNVQAE